MPFGNSPFSSRLELRCDRPLRRAPATPRPVPSHCDGPGFPGSALGVVVVLGIVGPGLGGGVQDADGEHQIAVVAAERDVASLVCLRSSGVTFIAVVPAARGAGPPIHAFLRLFGRDVLAAPFMGGGAHPAVPKIAVPTRTIVAPSSMATSKSWLMPIDSSPEHVPAATPSARKRSRSSRSSGNRAGRPRVVEQRRQQHQAGQPDARGTGPRARPGARTSSAARRASSSRPRDPLARSTSGAVPGLGGRAVHAVQQVDSVDRVDARERPAAFRALFDCRCPIRCHRTGRSVAAAIFCRASCTRFSPKSRWPAATAARTCVDRVTSSTRRPGGRRPGGGRPARPRARSAAGRPRGAGQCRLRAWPSRPRKKEVAGGRRRRRPRRTAGCGSQLAARQRLTLPGLPRAPADGLLLQLRQHGLDLGRVLTVGRVLRGTPRTPRWPRAACRG